jgi:hypothetical protein
MQLITGLSTPIAKGLPPAGVGADDLARLRELGRVLANQLSASWPPSGPLLPGLPTAEVHEHMILPELLAWPIFHAAAYGIRFAGGLGAPFRAMAVLTFVLCLVAMILFGLPLAILASRIGRLVAPNWLQDQVIQLRSPT